MDREGLEELFAPVAVVTVRRMFGGHGVYADGLCFALEIDGDVYLKVDAETEAQFAAVDSRPFVYAARGREVRVGYWLLPAVAFDDEDVLRRWASLALDAARRAAAERMAKGHKQPAVGWSRRRSDQSEPLKSVAPEVRRQGADRAIDLLETPALAEHGAGGRCRQSGNDRSPSGGRRFPHPEPPASRGTLRRGASAHLSIIPRGPRLAMAPRDEL